MALLVWASGCTGLGQSGKESKAETLARWHFAGTRALSNIKDLTVLRDILALKESDELRNAAADGVAGQMAGALIHGGETNANAQLTALIKPLLPDVVENESWFELSGRTADDAKWFLAVKLSAERAGQWNKNLADLAAKAGMQVSPADKGGSWTARRDNYRLSVTSGKEWLLLEGGAGQAGKSARIPKSGGKEVLTADINGPGLAKLWKSERFQHAPRLSLAVSPRKGTLYSEMQIDYPQPLNITPEAWQVPTDLIHDPLIGFTAVQGISGTLAQSPLVKQLGAEKSPNQAFFWSQSSMAFTVFGATDVGNPAVVISNLVAHPPAMLKDTLGGTMTVMTNRPAVLWRGLPVVVPFLEAGADGKSPYLVAGLFPVSSAKPKPMPTELLAQLNKKNLVYYDWEITQERLKQWRPIWQFAQIIQGKMFPPSASDRWIEAITPKLVNTVTEVTLEGPSRLKLVRQSQSGLTALELVLLAHWLDPYDVMERPPHNPNAPRAPRRNPAVPIQPIQPKH